MKHIIRNKVYWLFGTGWKWIEESSCLKTNKQIRNKLFHPEKKRHFYINRVSQRLETEMSVERLEKICKTCLLLGWIIFRILIGSKLISLSTFYHPFFLLILTEVFGVKATIKNWRNGMVWRWSCGFFTVR